MIYVLFTAHLVADWFCQTEWMALNKSKSWEALSAHVSVYALGLVTFALLSMSYHNDRVLVGQGLVFVLVNGAAHFATDAVTSRLTTRWWFLKIAPTGRAGFTDQPMFYIENTGTRAWFFNTIGVDQWVHLCTLVGTAQYLGLL